jgi:hypothetical protein
MGREERKARLLREELDERIRYGVFGRQCGKTEAMKRIAEALRERRMPKR